MLKPTTSFEAKAVDGTSRWRAPPPWALNLLKLVLSVVAIVAVVRSVDASAVWERIANQSFWTVPVAAAIMLFQILAGGLRWHVILRRLGGRAPLVEALRYYYISAFFNVCLWGAVGGDIVRAWLSYRADIDVKTAVTSVILDRIASVCAVAFLVLVTLPIFVAQVGLTASTLIPATTALAGLVGIVVAAQLDHLPVAWHRHRLLRGLTALGGAIRGIFLSASALVPVLAVALVPQIALSLSAYVVAKGLDIEVTLLHCIVLMQPVALATALPISIGGWGVREVTMVALFGLVGMPPSSALALSVQLGLLSIAAALPGALLFLMLRLRPRADEVGMAS